MVFLGTMNKNVPTVDFPLCLSQFLNFSVQDPLLPVPVLFFPCCPFANNEMTDWIHMLDRGEK